MANESVERYRLAAAERNECTVSGMVKDKNGKWCKVSEVADLEHRARVAEERLNALLGDAPASAESGQLQAQRESE